MKKLTYSILLALGSLPVLANTISGQVTDQSGNPVTTGQVSIEGTPLKAKINKDGSFSFPSVIPGEVKLHFASSKYVHEHKLYTVPQAGLTDVKITLTDASIEILDVTGIPFHSSTLEGSLPVSVLAGDKLNRQASASLGDTLANEVGVHSSSHGGVVSTPIIRGLSGPRVLITQNGLDASDVSRVGPDHLVTTEASNAQQIEVLRGPATLFYGSGAIGGVVNIVDNRIPSSELNEGEVVISGNTNNNEEAVSGNFATTQGNFVFSAGGFYREADEYEIPGMAELEEDDHDHDDHDEDEHDDHDEHGSENIVENSNYRNSGFNIGGSYLFDTGFIGFSVENQSSFYGIPGHAHGGEEHGHDEEHDDHEDEHEGEEHEEEVVNLDMNQDRYQINGGFKLSGDVVSSINFSAGFTDYEHIEIENGEPGTMFANQTTELRFESMHHEMSGWEGGLSFQYKKSDIEALGEEAFTPASETTMMSLSLLEEKQMGDFLVQLGARVERVELDVPELFESEVELLEDDDHDDDHEDHDEHEHGEAPGSISESFTPVSISAGLVWDYAKGYNATISVGRSQRAPSAAELFSLGPHLGSGNFEIGSLYEIDEENHVVAGAVDFDLETSNSIDLSFRKYEGDLGVIFNLFYNKVDNFYFDANTGFFAEFEHEHEEEEHDEHEEEHDDEHDHDEEHGDEHSEEGELLPVILFTSTDANIYGAELQVNYRATDNLTLRTQADFVRTRIDTINGTTEAPRTPPMRLFASAEYETNDYYFDIQLKHVLDQDKVSSFESSTDGYTLLDMNFSYYLTLEQTDVELFFKGRNLTDEEARVHTSYLRSDAPLPGRSFILGVRANF